MNEVLGDLLGVHWGSVFVKYSLMNIIYFSEEQDLSSSQISTDLASPLRIDFSDEEEVGAENYSQQRHLYSNSNPRRSQRNLKNPKLKFEEPALHPTRRRQLLTGNGKYDYLFSVLIIYTLLQKYVYCIGIPGICWKPG